MANLLPPNATDLERNIASVNGRLSDLPTDLRDLYNPDICPAEWLPWLAQSLSVDTWSPTWTEAQKRDSIKTSIEVHRLKGTIGAVRRALAGLGFDVRLQEWFNQIDPGAPFTFRLLLNADQVGFDQAAVLQVSNVVDATKNLRSHLTEIVPQVVTSARTVIAGVVGVGHEITTTYTAPDLDLLMEGAANGMAATSSAVDALYEMLHKKMPTSTYW